MEKDKTIIYIINQLIELHNDEVTEYNEQILKLKDEIKNKNSPNILKIINMKEICIKCIINAGKFRINADNFINQIYLTYNNKNLLLNKYKKLEYDKEIEKYFKNI